MKTKEERAAYMKAYRSKHQVKLNAYRKQYYNQNREKSKLYRKQYYEENKSAVTDCNKRYVQKNKANRAIYIKYYNKSRGAIMAKLRSHKNHDIINEREFNITYEYVSQLLVAQNNECIHCNGLLKLEWSEPFDPAQFSVNRINNRKGHIKGNVEITCLQCNREYGKFTHKNPRKNQMSGGKANCKKN